MTEPETFTFRVVHLLGPRPAHLPPGEAFVAPRPLLGTPVFIDELNNWAGLVVVEPADSEGPYSARRRFERVRNNRSMHAQLIVWTDHDEAIRAARDYLTAEYGAADVSSLTDATLLETWRYSASPKQVSVTFTPDPTHPTHIFENWTD